MQDTTNTRGATPPCTKGGQKQQHSPWSAPRQRKRRPPAQQVAQTLASLEEEACWTSPPKRLNGGGSPAARELPLHDPQLAPAFSAPAEALDAAGPVAQEPAGPLAQGLLTSQPGAEPGFSPLASGLSAPSFTAPSFEWPAAGAAAAPADKQRRQLRQVAAWRLASQRQRDAMAQQRRAASLDGGPVLASLALVPAAQGPSGAPPSHPPAGSVFSSVEWQPAIAASSGAPPAAPQQAQQAQQQHLGEQQAQQADAPQLPAPQAPLAAPPSPRATQQQQQRRHAPPAPHPQHLHEGEARPGSRLGGQGRPGSLARCSTGQDMETDLRSSWGSERSADVTSWQSLQARLREEAGMGGHAGRLPSAAAGLAAAIHRQASMASEGGDAAMRSADCGGSVHSGRSSLDAPSCSDRQTSQLPLRSAMRGPAWHSHLASPPEGGGDATSPDPLLGRSSGSSKQRSRGSNSKWGCFSCASPFSCRQRSGVLGDSDDDGEVVRRNDGPSTLAGPLSPLPPVESEGEEFIIRKGSLSRLGGASPASSGRGSAGRVKHTSLNRPPSGQDLLHRQDAFSARCTPPGAPWSPCGDGPSTGSDDGSFSLPSATHGLRSVSVGLRDGSIEELAGYSGGKAGGEGAAADVDSLNSMLKALSLCPTAHPKDAEAFVAQACADHAIQPNATTARTLEKMWAVHEQLYS